MRNVLAGLAASVCLSAAMPAVAGFTSTEVFLPSIGRITGQGGARFFTTVWATNLTSAPESFTLFFLKAGQANPSPASFSDTLAPGETKVYENVVETKLGLSNALGAARVTSTGEILVAERIFDQEPGTDLGQTEGLFFAGVPASFAISAGQSASIQGVDQGSSEDFRYNFALVETAGASADVNVQVFDGSGVLLGQKAFPLSAFEQIQPNVADVVPGFSSTNARITATVTGGSGHVLLAGAQVANVSQDSSGFEMSFRDDLLGGGGTAGVTSLNGLTGALTIAHGANTTVNVSGHTITIDAVGGGSGSGLTAVAHDNSLIGSGTAGIPLGIAPSGVGNAQLGAGAVTAAKISPGQVVTSMNGLHDAVALAAGSNITLTPAGNTITIASSASGGSGVSSLNGLTGGLAITAGSGISVTPSGSSIQIASTGGGSGGLTSVAHNATLTGDGTAGAPLGIAVPLSLSTSATGAAVTVSSFNGTGVVGNASSSVNTFGLEGTANGTSGISTSSTNAGVLGNSSGTFGVVGLSGTGTGVLAESIGGAGLLAESSFGVGLRAQTNSGAAAAVGQNASTAADSAGVLGIDGTGVSGQTGSLSAGVRGESSSHVGVQGMTKTGVAAVRGLNSSTANDTSGVFGRDGTGTSGISGQHSAGVRGESSSGAGVLGLSNTGPGVLALTTKDFAVLAAESSGSLSVSLVDPTSKLAILAFGDASIHGNLSVSGGNITDSGGLKLFVEPHPSDPTKEIRFVCLEGPESGTYFRGSGHIVGGFAKIDVPESFRDVTDEKGLTVVATAVGGPGSIWVVRKGLDQIILQASADVEFDYVVNGVRKAYRDFAPIASNRDFVPDGPDDKTFAFYAPEIQRRLVRTGIYNPDGTVNLETAKRMGWDQRWKKEEPQ